MARRQGHLLLSGSIAPRSGASEGAALSFAGLGRDAADCLIPSQIDLLADEANAVELYL